MSGTPAPTYNATKAAARYLQTESQGIPAKGKVLLVVGRDDSAECQHSLLNTGYDTTTSNGTPIRWLNAARDKSYERLSTMEGYVEDVEGDIYIGNRLNEDSFGQPFTGDPLDSVPAVIAVYNGRMLGIVHTGEIPNAKSFDGMMAKFDALIVIEKLNEAGQNHAHHDALSSLPRLARVERNR